MRMFFYGEEVRKVDKKGRICIARIEQKQLGKRPVIVKRGESLFLYPEDAIGRFEPSQIMIGKVDKQGRLCISQGFFKPSSLWKRVIVSGEGECLKIQYQKEFSYSELKELRIEEIEEIYRQGIAVVIDGDKKMVRLEQESKF